MRMQAAATGAATATRSRSPSTSRPLRRAIQRVIEDPLADFVLGRTLEPGSTILVARKGSDDDEVSTEVDITVIPGEVTPEKITVPPEPEDSVEEEEPSETA